MDITARNVEKFHEWLIARGRSEPTADLYRTCVLKCAGERSLTTRLVGGDLAPKSKHANAAALRAWAKFTKDPELAELVEDIRLPPAQRVKPKLPLDLEKWRAFVGRARTAKWMTPWMRATVLIIAVRGLRSGDALRIKRTEVREALKTGKLSFEGKGRKRHEIAAAPIHGALEELAADTSWERVSDLAGDVSPKAVSARVRRAVRRVAREAKVDGCHPHRLRRTVAHQFLRQLGPDPLAMAKLLKFMGWSNIQTAMSYVGEIEVSDVQDIGDKISASLD